MNNINFNLKFIRTRNKVTLISEHQLFGLIEFPSLNSNLNLQKSITSQSLRSETLPLSKNSQKIKDFSEISSRMHTSGVTRKIST